MRILVAGKNGQASLAFADLLLDKKIPFLALGKSELDVTNLEQIRTVAKEYQPDVIFNGAAYNAVDRAETDWETAFLVNGIGPRNLAIVAEERDIPLVTFSTDYVFDGKKKVPYTIADIPNPLNAYGKSKLLGEHFVQSLCQKYVLARVSWVFGVKGKLESNFLKKILEWAGKKEELHIVEDQISSPTYAPDLAEEVLAKLEAKEWGLCHLSNRGYCSRYEWAKEILTLAKWRGEIYPAKSDDFNVEAQRPVFSTLSQISQRKGGNCFQDWKDATLDFYEKYVGAYHENP